MIKRVINTNISLQDAFTNMIEASVANILIQKGIENGDANQVTDLGDVKKKTAIGKVVSIDENTAKCKLKLDDGSIIDCKMDNGSITYIPYVYDSITFDYDETGSAYFVNYIGQSNNVPNRTTLLASDVIIQSNGENDVTDNILYLLNKNEKDGVNAGISIENKRIKLNVGNTQLGGLIEIEELTKILNELLNAIKKLELSFNTHTHAVAGTATAVPNSPSTNITSVKPFNQSEYENKNITHSK